MEKVVYSLCFMCSVRCPIKILVKDGQVNWILTGWQGGILKHSDILKFNSAEEQYERVRKFYNSGINLLSE